MTDGGEQELVLTADHSAEMIEQRARFPRLRNRSLFVGSAEDVVPDSFGPGLPGGEWSQNSGSPWSQGHGSTPTPFHVGAKPRWSASCPSWPPTSPVAMWPSCKAA